jgi:hypothetical protein
MLGDDMITQHFFWHYLCSGKIFHFGRCFNMKKILPIAILCFAFYSPTQASNVITFGKDFSIVFPHKQHQSIYTECTECHGAVEPGQIAQFGEKWAHKTCAGCHSENKAGPVECSECHPQS